jgi:hypothetical protein
VTDLYETRDKPEEAENYEEKPGESIEQITAKVLSKQVARIAELESGLRLACESACDGCCFAPNGREGDEICGGCEINRLWDLSARNRGPVAENVEG